MIEKPLVSVIIPVYNGESFIEETITAVLNQSYPSVEIILIDDGSTDGTSNLIDSLGANRSLQIIHQVNKGAAAARNRGYQQSGGAYIKFLDADDIINVEMIAEQVKLAIDHPDSIISSKWGRFYNNDLSTFKLSPEECWQDMPAQDWLCSSWKYTASTTVPGVFLIPRKIIEQAGLWNESLTLLDDTEYFARTILRAKNVIFSPNSTLYYRSGLQHNLSGRKDATAVLSAFKAYQGMIGELFAKQKDNITQQLAANIWQLFIYNTYPENPELIRLAQKALAELPQPNLPYPAGGYTHILNQIIGWKATKVLKSFFAKIT
ncbi:MAG: glycosyltransferase family 2 protein [Mucilaginibacter sp.]|nr:glycosyltransferase family 2 protein [Mucilaginibacter sp.]